jgi:hypothetical protein
MLLDVHGVYTTMPVKRPQPPVGPDQALGPGQRR